MSRSSDAYIVVLVVMMAALVHVASCLGSGPFTSTYAGGASSITASGVPATMARLRQPLQCTFDPSGNLVVADTTDGCVRSIDPPTQYITTIAGGCGFATYSGDGTSATIARFGAVRALVYDSTGNLYLADTTVRSIS